MAFMNLTKLQLVRLLVGCLYVASARGVIQETFENEVLKTGKPLPEVDEHFLEAYYYDIYDTESRSRDAFLYRRAGRASENTSCSHVREVPDSLRSAAAMRPDGLDRGYYTKYTEAYGIPVLGSSDLPDRALSRACYVLRFLLADVAVFRNEFYKSYGRVVIIPSNDVITDVPEYSFLSPRFDSGTRGLGAVPVIPVSSAAEENVLCDDEDEFRKEDVLLKEIALGIFHLAAKKLDPSIDRRLRGLYSYALESNKWANTYAEHSPDAYLGKGIQSFFNVNGYAYPADGVYNRVNSRTKLRQYDHRLYSFILSMFPCVNNYMKRCNSRENESYQRLRRNCSPVVRPWTRRRFN